MLRVYPERETRLDRDGLLLIDDGLRLADRGIFCKGHVLDHHRFFRSGDHGSSPNSDFLWQRRQYYAETKDRNLFAIAINRARLMPKEDYADFIESPDWRGPRFSQHMLQTTRRRWVLRLSGAKRSQIKLFRIDGTVDADKWLDLTAFFVRGNELVLEVLRPEEPPTRSASGRDAREIR